MNWRFWKREVGVPDRPEPKTQLPGLPSEDARTAAYLKAPGNDLFGAVVADLREFAVEVSDRALDAALPDGTLRWHLGGSDALLEFLEKLQERERQARLTAEQIEAQKKEEEEPAAA